MNTTYLKRLALKVAGVGSASLLAMAAAAQPFNVLTFNWGTSLTVAGSAAVLALLEGLAGGLTGDRDQPTVTR
jgi:ABC-type nitrate/sulfonate/bicarbonate transport system substrate-binding protein